MFGGGKVYWSCLCLSMSSNTQMDLSFSSHNRRSPRHTLTGPGMKTIFELPVNVIYYVSLRVVSSLVQHFWCVYLYMLFAHHIIMNRPIWIPNKGYYTRPSLIFTLLPYPWTTCYGFASLGKIKVLHAVRRRFLLAFPLPPYRLCIYDGCLDDSLKLNKWSQTSNIKNGGVLQLENIATIFK